MPWETPPAPRRPRSAYTHSRLVLDWLEATSPGWKPSATSPMPTSRAARPSSVHVTARQMPRSFWRRITCGPRVCTPCQNRRATLPCSIAFMRLSPLFLPLPATLSAHAGRLHAEVELLDVLLLRQVGA